VSENLQNMEREVLEIEISDKDLMLQTMYESVYRKLIENGYMPPWEDVFYHAPETTPGYAVRLLQHGLNRLRYFHLIP
jgi:hypothetical protein